MRERPYFESVRQFIVDEEFDQIYDVAFLNETGDVIAPQGQPHYCILSSELAREDQFATVAKLLGATDYSVHLMLPDEAKALKKAEDKRRRAEGRQEFWQEVFERTVKQLQLDSYLNYTL